MQDAIMLESMADDPGIIILFASDAAVDACMSRVSITSVAGTWRSAHVVLSSPQRGKRTDFSYDVCNVMYCVVWSKCSPVLAELEKLA